MSKEIGIYSDFIEFSENDLINYYYYTNTFTSEEMEKLESQLDELKLYKGTIDSGANNVNLTYRDSRISWLPKIDKYLWIYKKIGDLAIKANKTLWNFDLIGMSENLQYTEYDESYKGFYDWHCDVGSGNSAKRKISISIQLSGPEEYEGGELKLFYKRKQVITPKEKGTMILFPSFMMHKVEPVTRGKRRSLVIWISGPAFR